MAAFFPLSLYWIVLFAREYSPFVRWVGGGWCALNMLNCVFMWILLLAQKYSPSIMWRGGGRYALSWLNSVFMRNFVFVVLLACWIFLNNVVNFFFWPSLAKCVFISASWLTELSKATVKSTASLSKDSLCLFAQLENDFSAFYCGIRFFFLFLFFNHEGNCKLELFIAPTQPSSSVWLISVQC